MFSEPVPVISNTQSNAPFKKAPTDVPEVHTESETSESSSSDSHSNSNSTFGLDIPNYDDKGRCVKHPHIKLRKKKMLGGWKVLLNNCPDCCVEEMLKMRRNSADNSRKSRSQGKKKNKNEPEEGSQSTSSSSDRRPPIAQLNIKGRGDDRSIGSASASTITYQSGENMWQQYVQRQPSVSGNGANRVMGMPFTDANGDRGWYTGDVAMGSGLPHGMGQMNYCDGRIVRDRWVNGVDLQQQQEHQHGSFNENSSSGDGSSSGRHRQHHRQQPPPPPRQSQQRKSRVVCGLEWTDLDGQSGFFTGELNEDSGEPHGMGSMRYHDGGVLEGQWYEGSIC